MQAATVLILITILCLYYINIQTAGDVYHFQWDVLAFVQVQYSNNEFGHLKEKGFQQRTIEAQIPIQSIFQSKEVEKSPTKSNPVTPIQTERLPDSLHDLQTKQDNSTKVIPHPSPPGPLPKAISLDSGNYTLKDFGTTAINQYDYPNITYPIPFNQLYNNKSMRYVDFGKPNSRLPSFVQLGEVSESSFRDVDYIVVTGSSSNHLYSNLNTIYSILLADIRVSIVFVDFGLEDEPFTVLVREMKTIQAIYEQRGSWGQLYYRKFDFGHFPAWFDINDRMIRGGYSWKVISYADVLMESRRMVFWSDGGNQVPASLESELSRAREYGLFTPCSGGSLQQWLHGRSIRFLGWNKMLRKLFLGKSMCTGGYLFIHYNNTSVMQNVLIPLLQCAYTRRCISPLGSSRRNHRQDQAILSALVQSEKIPMSCQQKYNTEVRFHQECNSDEKCRDRREELIQKLQRGYVYDRGS